MDTLYTELAEAHRSWARTQLQKGRATEEDLIDARERLDRATAPYRQAVTGTSSERPRASQQRHDDLEGARKAKRRCGFSAL